MSDARARKFQVLGRVQGVAFRAHTRQQALALGLSGYARNLADGTVEVLAIGQPAALAQLEAWLWRGPSLARVDQLVLLEDRVVATADLVASAGFAIG